MKDQCAKSVSIDPEKLFSENEDIAQTILEKILPEYKSDDDYKQIALMGLWCACLRYQGEYRQTPQTYLQESVKRELTQYRKRQQKDPNRSVLSLDMPVCVRREPSQDSEEDNSESDNGFVLCLRDVIPAETTFFDGFSKELLQRAYRTLSAREQRILQLIIEGYTLEAVGKEFNITRERVRQIYAKAKRKIRTNIQYWGYSL